MISKGSYLSCKLTRISFVCAVMVVLIHAQALRGELVVTEACRQFHALTQFFVWSPVPIFFIISGFVFGCSGYASSGGVSDFWRRKAKSLLVPYMIVAFFSALIMLPVTVSVNLQKHQPLMASSCFEGESLFDIVNNIFAISTTSPLANGPLWYVRALLILFAFAPLLRLIVRCVNRWVILGIASAILWMAKDPFNTVVPILSLRIMFVWFFVGMFFAKCPECVNWKGSVLSRISVLGVASIWALVGLPFRPLAQLVILWVGYDFVFEKMNWKTMSSILGLSFWIYLMHPVVSNYVVPIGHCILGKSTIALCSTTVLNFMACVGLSILFGLFMKRKCPLWYAIISGGRI